MNNMSWPVRDIKSKCIHYKKIIDTSGPYRLRRLGLIDEWWKYKGSLGTPLHGNAHWSLSF